MTEVAVSIDARTHWYLRRITKAGLGFLVLSTMDAVPQPVVKYRTLGSDGRSERRSRMSADKI